MADLKKLYQHLKTDPLDEGDLGQALMEKKANIDAVRKADMPKPVARPVTGPPMNPKAKYGDKPGEKRINVDSMVKPLGQMHEGGEIPQTGAYIMKKGEHVLTPEHKARIQDAFGLAESALAHKESPEPQTPPKQVREMRIRKAEGGHVVNHSHVNSMHQDEEHVVPHGKLAAHVAEHMPDEDGGKQAVEKALGFKMAKPASYAEGGKVKEGGMAMVHKGETVIPANKPVKNPDIYIGGDKKTKEKPFVPFGNMPKKNQPSPKQSRDEIRGIRKLNDEEDFETPGSSAAINRI